MTPQEIQSIASAFSNAWGLLFNTSVSVLKSTGATAGINNVYHESKQKTFETFGPFNASVQYQPTMQLLNDNGLWQPSNAMIIFVYQDLQNAIGSNGTQGYIAPSTQDRVIVPWLDGTTKTQHVGQFALTTQFGGSFIFMSLGVVDVLK